MLSHEYIPVEELDISRSKQEEIQQLRLSLPCIPSMFVVWDVMIHFLGDLDPLSRIAYCDAIDLNLFFAILDKLFLALPVNPDLGFSYDLFSDTIRPQCLAPFDADHFFCNLYFRTLCTVPATVRDWYATCNRQQASAINKYTKKHVSRQLIQREMRNISNTKRGKLNVRVLSAVNEVECIYRLEDSEIRLCISLPPDFPLAPPKIETERSIFSKDLHRKWLFQLEVFISRQNGPLLDGILQWKRNVDQHLKGVEDCTICMMTVSSTNYQLPKIRCRQCKKKFHGDCLSKWFQTSQKSTCPLCRTNFI